MLILNTTSIPEQTIRLIASVVKPINIPEVASIQLRNKAKGKITGNWGYYFSHDNRITLCVPQHISEYEAEATHTKRIRSLVDINDFLALVIGHEYYHAYQYIHERSLWYDKEYIEIGAENYEPRALELWNNYKIEVGWKEIKKVAKVNYRDFR